jgi:hypothetical protein
MQSEERRERELLGSTGDGRVVMVTHNGDEE